MNDRERRAEEGFDEQQDDASDRVDQATSYLSDSRASVSDMSTTFARDFREFMFANKVVSAAAGFSIGSATKTFIEELMDKIVLPVLIWLRGRSMRVLPKVTSVYLSKLLSVGWTIIMYATIVVMTFVLLEYILNKKVLGMRSHVSMGEAIDFAISKALAKLRGIFPTNAVVKADRASEIADIIKGMRKIQKNSKENELLVSALKDGDGGDDGDGEDDGNGDDER